MTLTTVLPKAPLTGGASLSGLLTKSTEPLLQNLGWVGGANSGVADQIGPGWVVKRGPGDYIMLCENDTGAKSLDVGNQSGAFDFDVPTIGATSTDGTNWTIANQNDPSNAVINCNNVSGSAGFKTAVKGETSVGTFLWDPDDALWKAWFHGGNASGTRKIYYATCSGDPLTAGNWTIQNSSNAVVSNGTGWEADWVADARVIRINSSLMVMLYRGFASGVSQIGQATSTDRGLTWSKSGSNPVLAKGAAGSWNAGSVYAAGFVYDAPLGLYLCWYGARSGVGSVDEAIGFAYSSDSESWTQGLFNPVLCKKDGASGTNAFEDVIASTISAYLDGSTYRLMIKADNGVSGVTGFRGRIEATIRQVVQPFTHSRIITQAVHRAASW